MKWNLKLAPGPFAILNANAPANNLICGDYDPLLGATITIALASTLRSTSALDGIGSDGIFIGNQLE